MRQHVFKYKRACLFFSWPLLHYNLHTTSMQGKHQSILLVYVAHFSKGSSSTNWHQFGEFQSKGCVALL